MKVSALLLAVLILPACGGFSLFKDPKLKERKIASVEVKSSAAEMTDQLNTLHSYYLLGQKKLISFDESIVDLTQEELYQSDAYVALAAIKSQVEIIENDLLKHNHVKMKKAVLEYSQSSHLALLSMTKLAGKLNLKLTKSNKVINLKTVEDAIHEAHSTKKFQIIEMNIEHLSYMIEIKNRDHNPARKNIDTLDWMAQHPDKIVERTKKLMRKTPTLCSKT
jgi:hypothetical protein